MYRHAHYRRGMILDDLLVKYKIDGLTEDEKEHLSKAWHRLDPWPEAVAGLTRLRRRFVLAPLSEVAPDVAPEGWELELYRRAGGGLITLPALLVPDGRLRWVAARGRSLLGADGLGMPIDRPAWAACSPERRRRSGGSSPPGRSRGSAARCWRRSPSAC